MKKCCKASRTGLYRIRPYNMRIPVDVTYVYIRSTPLDFFITIRIHCFLVHKIYGFSMRHRLSRSSNYWFRKLEGWFRSLMLVFFIVSIYFVLLYKRQNPGMTPLMVMRSIDQMVVGKKIIIKHFWVPIDHISNAMIYAVIAGEDQRYLQHRGVDFEALRDAFIYNIKQQTITLWWSTITQQTAKNVFLRPNRSLLRKWVELYFALMIELLRSKERIMEVYLNIIEFWNGIYWVEQAAQYYFNISAGELTQRQSSFLVAMMPNPRYYEWHQRSYRLNARKSIINRSVTTMKKDKDINIFVQSTKKK